MKADPKVPSSPLVYKTGDLAVRLSSGDLRFMGRVDRQVKVRGFRIELEAVEAVLKEYKPPLKQLAVVAVKEQRGNELARRPAVHSVVGHSTGAPSLSVKPPSVATGGPRCLPLAQSQALPYTQRLLPHTAGGVHRQGGAV